MNTKITKTATDSGKCGLLLSGKLFWWFQSLQMFSVLMTSVHDIDVEKENYKIEVISLIQWNDLKKTNIFEPVHQIKDAFFWKYIQVYIVFLM